MTIFADVGIGPSGSLESTARILGEILRIDFKEDVDGRYDEFPAYVADFEGARFALLGTPSPEDDLRDEPTNDFQLMVRPIVIDRGNPKRDVSEAIVSKISEDGRVDGWVLN